MRMPIAGRVVRWSLLLTLLAAAPAWAQDIGRLVSPGPLSAAHAKLEGLNTCEKCHQPGEGVSAKKCLSCHQPIADRIARKTGVHRDVTGDCNACHVEHAGRDADIRPLDKGSFDHLEETGFPLDGRHEAIGRDCAKCHKTRSFLTLDPACGSCHKDSHNGALGVACAACHVTTQPFAQTATGFDHSRAAFKLEGAHAAVACAKCHPTRQYRGLKFAECSACHQEPHAGKLGAACSTCHTPAGWRTRSMDHTKTGFALVGAHAILPCTTCHVQPATKVTLAHGECRDCHKDAHLGVFSEDCAACHNPTSFAGGTFDHAARTEFPLADRHAEIACVACHKQPEPVPGAPRTVDFRGASKDCASCHKDPHAGALGTACAGCHGTRAFTVAAFQHPRFPEFFTGKHAGLECAKCHKGAAAVEPGQSVVATRTYRGLSTECATCHKDAHLGQLGAQCAACHSIAAATFKQVSFDHSRAEFPLTGKHATIECVTCHKSVTGEFPAGTGTAVQFKGTSGSCITCHKDVHLGQLGDHCSECHRTDSFKLASHTHRGEPDFFTGGHAAIECRQCHRTIEADFPSGHGEAIQFTNLDRQCSTCHEDVHKTTLGDDCASCHTVHAPFRDPSRAFHKSTMLPLEGRHLQVPCADCHWDGQIKGTPTRCYDCHWIRRQDDRYRTRLGNECEQCHRPTSWTAVNWDHGVATGHALRGAHSTLDCEACHVDGRFDPGLGTDCASCHLEDYQAADDPNHVSAGFPTTCESCHSPSDSSWDQARFDHGTYPLVGVHAAQPCEACHSSGIYQGLPSECVDCHLDDYQGTEDPEHAAAGFPTTCDDCHNASDTSWDLGHFDHGTYPLVGAHAAQPCEACHSSGVYQGLPSDCVDCHLDDYQGAQDPDHVAAGFPTDCTQCHDAADPEWGDGQFGHDTYPLVGVHAAQPCEACHSSGVYQGLPSACVDCHLDDYQGAQNPDHVAAGFPTDCTQCHDAADPEWGDGQYGHDTYPLVGVHAAQPCEACHSSGVYQGLPSDCVDCHLDDYQGTTDPDHAAAGFPTDCQLCHDAADPNWDEGTFDHGTYPLVGVHAAQPCEACHSSGVYQGLPSACVDCHLDDYQGAQNPDHVAAGFPTDCTQCHDAADPEWGDGTFDHGTYPLVGVHAAQPCEACHSGGVYQGLPSDCVDCHLDDYQGTTDPDHAAAGFPTDCQLCHDAADPNWDEGTFDHGTYPLVGVHAAQPCSACHSSGVYQGLPSDCVDCHLDDYQGTTDPNHAAAGFPTDCQLCHDAADPSWDEGQFDHIWFPIASGTHSGFACSECHPNPTNFAIFTCTTACHPRSETDEDHLDVPGYVYDSPACLSCHPDGSARFGGPRRSRVPQKPTWRQR